MNSDDRLVIFSALITAIDDADIPERKKRRLRRRLNNPKAAGELIDFLERIGLGDGELLRLLLPYLLGLLNDLGD